MIGLGDQSQTSGRRAAARQSHHAPLPTKQRRCRCTGFRAMRHTLVTPEINDSHDSFLPKMKNNQWYINDILMIYQWYDSHDRSWLSVFSRNWAMWTHLIQSCDSSDCSLPHTIGRSDSHDSFLKRMIHMICCRSETCCCVTWPRIDAYQSWARTYNYCKLSAS